MAAILMAEEYWRTSQFSIAQYYGEIKVNIGSETIHYIIVNKEGKDIFECSVDAERAGRSNAIEPGDPADLIDRRYIQAYRMMGREAFIKMIKECDVLTPEIAMELAKEYVSETDFGNKKNNIIMNEKLDLVEILKDCPKGTKLYSTVFGQVKLYLIRTGDYPIVIETQGGFLQYLSGNGILYKETKDSECILFPSKDQRDWSKFRVPVKKFDYSTLKPFDNVLVRNDDRSEWRVALYSYIKGINRKIMMCELCWNQGIPYNDETKHLVGTSDMPDEKYIWWED